MELNKDKKIKAISINGSDSMLFALKKMDKIHRRLLLVFNGDQFINILSLGDIQRGIIQNKNLNSPVAHILRKETKTALTSDSDAKIKQQMLKYRTECMPILNDQNQLVDVYFWEEIFPPEQKRIQNKINLPVIIMAGGKGTRMKPLTNVLPKALIPIEEKTILEEIMQRFSEIGCNQFYLSVNHKAEMIRHYFEQLNYQDYTINYLKEEKPLGTAGSLYLLKNKINQSFFVSNCDILIDDDYGEIYKYHKNNNNELTIVAALKHYPIPYGTIKSGNNGILQELNEKPELTFKINSGMYILEPHLINEIPENEFFHITYLIEKVKKRGGKIGVFPVSENSWRDIGEWKEFIKNIKQ